ncbi:MAG: hypothetical protein GX126_07470 [Bacteroidales bacterium]|nr:hypothetical protein [Bacteroidales bacterium]
MFLQVLWSQDGIFQLLTILTYRYNEGAVSTSGFFGSFSGYCHHGKDSRTGSDNKYKNINAYLIHGELGYREVQSSELFESGTNYPGWVMLIVKPAFFNKKNKKYKIWQKNK